MGGIGSGKKPREYPADIVDRVVTAYNGGATVAEVQRMLPPGYKAQRIIERFIPERRVAAKREQRGARNHMWKGDAAGYQAAHLRVESARGKPSRCSACDATEGHFDWANLTGKYHEIHDFIRLCRSCHHRFDAARRRATGRSTRPQEVMPYV